MSRLLAFVLLGFAAFDLPAPWLDRLGLASLGFAFLAWGLVPGGLWRRAPGRMNLPPKTAELRAVEDELNDDVLGLIERYSVGTKTND